MKMVQREIKFRAWDKLANKMSPEFALFGEFTLLGAVHAWQDEFKTVGGDSIGRLNDLIIMQYTGLKDKNGKEIYDGDIVHSARHKHFPYSRLCVVEIATKGVFLSPRGNTVGDYLLNFNNSQLELVGNIYENPELLV